MDEKRRSVKKKGTKNPSVTKEGPRNQLVRNESTFLCPSYMSLHLLYHLYHIPFRPSVRPWKLHTYTLAHKVEGFKHPKQFPLHLFIPIICPVSVKDLPNLHAHSFDPLLVKPPELSKTHPLTLVSTSGSST